MDFSEEFKLSIFLNNEHREIYYSLEGMKLTHFLGNWNYFSHEKHSLHPPV